MGLHHFILESLIVALSYLLISHVVVFLGYLERMDPSRIKSYEQMLHLTAPMQYVSLKLSLDSILLRMGMSLSTCDRKSITHLCLWSLCIRILRLLLRSYQLLVPSSPMVMRTIDTIKLYYLTLVRYASNLEAMFMSLIATMSNLSSLR
jgi:hypothetical protein